MVRRLVGASALALALAAASGCSSPPLLPPHAYGEPHHAFSISFGETPVHEEIADGNQLWGGGGVIVRVMILEKPVDAAKVGSFLRGYLSSSHGGRLVTRFGLPAATGIWPCFSPAPGCRGFDGDLDVLDGLTVYDVHTSGLDWPTTQAALDSLRIP
jgi:hypothetical protein